MYLSKFDKAIDNIKNKNCLFDSKFISREKLWNYFHKLTLQVLLFHIWKIEEKEKGIEYINEERW